jgi:hypothetical protein
MALKKLNILRFLSAPIADRVGRLRVLTLAKNWR